MAQHKYKNVASDTALYDIPKPGNGHGGGKGSYSAEPERTSLTNMIMSHRIRQNKSVTLRFNAFGVWTSDVHSKKCHSCKECGMLGRNALW
jgi:hypothetical protein